ncbi:MAG: GAF domain-containing protein [bacterium]
MEIEKNLLLDLIYNFYCKYDHIDDIVKAIREGFKQHYEAESCFLLIDDGSFEPIIPCDLYSTNKITHCFKREELKNIFSSAQKGEYPKVFQEKGGIYRSVLPLLDSKNKPFAILNMESKKEGLLEEIRNNILKHIELSVRINQSIIKRWNSLANLTKNLMSKLSDTTSLMDEVVKSVTEELEAEACSLFLVSKDNLNYLELARGWISHNNKSFPMDITNVRLEIAKGEKTGLSGFVAEKKEPLSLAGEEIEKHPSYSGRSQSRPYLSLGRCFSWLGVPIINPGDRLLGIIKVENKKKNGRVDKGLNFSKEDEGYLEILASIIAICLEVASYIKRREEMADTERLIYYTSSHGLKTPLHGLLESIRQLEELDQAFIKPQPELEKKYKRRNEIFSFLKEDAYKYARLVQNICYMILAILGEVIKAILSSLPGK